MEQSEKNIYYNGVALADIAEINIRIIARGDYPSAYRNMCGALEKHFDTALLRWRRGESPVPDMEKALATSGEMFAAISDWQLDDETLNGYGHVWMLVGYTAYLLNTAVTLSEDRLRQIREDRSQYADVALDYCLLDALEGHEWRSNIALPLEQFATKKRHSLAVESYRTYFALLDANGDNAAVNALVQVAEVNYKKRARDGFYGGGPTYTGGGPDNPYVVDFQLAAILKKIRWAGDSIHRYRWG